jgi:hypothetical protein
VVVLLHYCVPQRRRSLINFKYPEQAKPLCVYLYTLGRAHQYTIRGGGGGGFTAGDGYKFCVFRATKVLVKDAWVSLLTMQFVQLNIITRCVIMDSVYHKF